MKDKYIIEYPLINTSKRESDFIEFMRKYKSKSGTVYFKLIDEPNVRIVTKEEYLRYINEN
jgi:hypothetical protein